MRFKINVDTLAQAYLELLHIRGIDYFFGNPGSEFTAIIDAFAHRREQGRDLPRPVAVPHEAPLLAMAHGYYLMTGRPQVGMVHVGVGTANGLGVLMGASRGRIPILFCAGRSPINEEGPPASRSTHVHWGQEYFDQAAMLRQFVKWDYELRNPLQLESVVDRAMTLAMSEPKGPVYLTMPREVLSVPMKETEFQSRLRYDLPTYYPDPAKIEEAADLLINAHSPLIITSSVGRSRDAVQSLVKLAEAGAIGVISFNPVYMNFPISHPCHQGFSPGPLLSSTDVILVIDCGVPWVPNLARPQDRTRIIQAGIDPLHSDYVMRSFPSDLTLQGDPVLILSELIRLLSHHGDRDETMILRRMETLRVRHQKLVEGWHEAANQAANDTPLDARWVSYNVDRLLGEDTVIVNEYDNSMKEYSRALPARFFVSPEAGYLGWALGAALGIKLALPDSLVAATVGDGSYMFSVPSACHFVSKTQQLPILVIVYNNQCWYGPKRSTRILHPDGAAARTNRFPLTELEALVHFEKFCEACGGYGERVETPDQVAPALERAIHAVKVEKRQALLNMICRNQ